MNEPEKITLRRLPPEHVLRKDVDLLKQRDVRNSFEIVHGLAGTAVERAGGKYSACYCRAEDYPPEYDKPAIDPGEGWRLLEKGERLQKGDEVLFGAGWVPINLWATKITVGHNNYRRRDTPQPGRLTELRQQCERQAAQIESLQTQVRSAEEALRVEKQKHDEAVKQLDVLHTPFGNIGRDISVHSQAAAWSRVTKTLDECIPDWNKEAAEISAMEAACASIRDLATLSEQRSEMIDSLLGRVHELEVTCTPLRWERRKPTEEECRERWILIEDGAYPPACTDIKDWEKMGAREICVLPPIAEPEPEPKMVTQRRWLCHNGSHSWVEVWPDDGDEPTDQWVERVRTDVTREVPE